MFKVSSILVALALSLTGIPAASASGDCLGYGKTGWGMSPDQVIDVESPNASLQLDGRVAIANAKIGPHLFDAELAFDKRTGQSLTRTTLISQATTESANMVVFADTEASLTASFGAPSSNGSTSGTTQSTTTTWRLPSTLITLTHSFVSATGDSTVSVVYQPALGGTP